MTIESQAHVNRIRNPVLAQLSEEARHVESQSRCNSKACICYGNAIIAITLFIFSFCSIVFIIIFVEYEVIENSIEHHSFSPDVAATTASSVHHHLGVSHLTSSTTARPTDDVAEEKSVEKAILDAIANRPTDEDDLEEGRLKQYELNLNVTKIYISTSMETDPGKFLHYMTKSEWQSDEPVNPSVSTNVMHTQKLLVLPTRRVIVSHTGGKTCNSTVSFLLLGIFHPVSVLGPEFIGSLVG